MSLHLPTAMQPSQQDIHVYGHDASVVPASDDRPDTQPLQPPPRRRLSPFRVLLVAFVSVCILLGVVAFLVWLMYRPRAIQVTVDAATLSRFVVNSTASPAVLSFNLTVALAITNPNRRVSLYYELQVEGLYQDERFGRTALPVSFQGARRTDAVRTVLAGSSAVGVGSGFLESFSDGNGTTTTTGGFPVDLWIDGVVRYKFGELVTTPASTLSVKCPLVLRLMESSDRVDCIVNS